MRKRGKVLRDASGGAGLLIVDGQQYPFLIEELWKSELRPRPGMVVEVEFEQYGKIRAVCPLVETQLSSTRTKAWWKLPAKLGISTPLAAALLLGSWTLLTAASVQTPLANQDFTFWQVLGLLDAARTSGPMRQGQDHSGAGFYGFLALAAVAGPFGQVFWEDKRAALGGLLPLVFMATVGLRIQSGLQSSPGSADAIFGAVTKDMANVSIGVGAYLSVLVSLYFAGTATRQVVSRKALNKADRHGARGAAA